MLVIQNRPISFSNAGLQKKAVNFGNDSQKKQEQGGTTRRQFIKDTAAWLAIAGLGGMVFLQDKKIETLEKGQKANSLARIPELVKEVGPSTVAIGTRWNTSGDITKIDGKGSGFIIEDAPKNLLIISNDHGIRYNVLEDEKTGKKCVKIYFYNQDKSVIPATAELIASDPGVDLAVLKFLPDQKIPDFVKPIKKFGYVDKRGIPAITIGCPRDLEDMVNFGVVSNIGVHNLIAPAAECFTIDAPINQGNSGGGTFGLNGELLGVNNAVSTDAHDVGYSISTKTLSEFLKNNDIHVPGLTDQ